MEWLNYHHLLYFWTVAREGGIVRAGEKLRLAPQTVSSQVHELEEALGQKLFERSGRRLVLTETGRVVLGYADEIFALGRELLGTVHGRPTGRPLPFRVGVADVVPKLVAHRLLAPSLALDPPARLSVTEGRHDRLLAALAVHELDAVLTDTPVGAGSAVRAYNHVLGDCGTTFFATPALGIRRQAGFPGSLDGAPFLMPGEGTALHRALAAWFETEGLRPEVIAEFDDTALLEVFGQDGAGLFAAPSAIATEVTRQYGVVVVGATEEVRARYYAISPERRLKHPAVVALTGAARGRFG